MTAAIRYDHVSTRRGEAARASSNDLLKWPTTDKVSTFGRAICWLGRELRPAGSVLVAEQPARLISLPRLIVVALRRRRIAPVVVILRLLLIGLGVVDAAAWCRIARLVRRTVGRIDVAVIGPRDR